LRAIQPFDVTGAYRASLPFAYVSTALAVGRGIVAASFFVAPFDNPAAWITGEIYISLRHYRAGRLIPFACRAVVNSGVYSPPFCHDRVCSNE
jgi:hypothetical protein